MAAAATDSKTAPSADAKPADADKMQIIDKAKALDQCGDDPAFLSELLGDVLNESEQKLTILKDALKKDDHKCFSETAHAIKGAALNLHLEALGFVSKATEFLGKALMANKDNKEKLAERAAWLTRMEFEYKRLREWIAAAAAAEAAA